MVLPQSQSPVNGSGPSNGFASAIKSPKKSTNECAIIIQNALQADYEEYFLALMKHVPGSKIATMKPSSKNRLIVWLDSKQTADNLLATTRYLIVAHQKVAIRPYITKNKRIVFTPVFPQVEDDFIVSELLKFGVTTKTEITSVRAGFKHKDLAHINTTKRQTYIDPDDVDKLPEKILSKVEGNDIWIYIVPDSACYICKSIDHLKKDCPHQLHETKMSQNVMETSHTQLNNADFPPPPKPKHTNTRLTGKINAAPKIIPENSPPTDPQHSSVLAQAQIHQSETLPIQAASTTPGTGQTPLSPPERYEVLTKTADKRPLSESVSSKTTISTNRYDVLREDNDNESNLSDASVATQSSQKKSRNPRKKVKKTDNVEPQSQDTSDEKYSQFIAYMDSADPPLEMSGSQFMELVNETRNPSDIFKNALKYSSNLKEVQIVFEYAMGKFPGIKRIKNRLHKIHSLLQESNYNNTAVSEVTQEKPSLDFELFGKPDQDDMDCMASDEGEV